MSDDRRLLGVVLAGGASRRMGTDKSRLPHPGGGTFLSHALSRLQGICDQIAVSGQVDVTDVSIPTLIDPVAYQGPVTGIVTAIGFARQHQLDAVLVTPVDMPALSKSDLQPLITAWRTADRLCCAVSSNDSRLQPLVAIYPVNLHEALTELAASTDRSLTRWLSNQQPTQVPLPQQSCHNVNAPSDL